MVNTLRSEPSCRRFATIVRPSSEAMSLASLGTRKNVTTVSKSDLYRLLTSVDELLKSPELAPLLAREGQPVVTESVRAVVANLREEIHSGTLATQESVLLAAANLPQAVTRHLSRAMEFSLKPVINATGVILHTNLGRAPLAESAIRRIAEVAGRLLQS